ncbi:hypothetical protein CIW50_28760 [Tardiphaga sp. P9-11]|nr:hypothetical protein CIW50_28760 [Tardiphaga sp. P9-11]
MLTNSALALPIAYLDNQVGNEPDVLWQSVSPLVTTGIADNPGSSHDIIVRVMNMTVDPQGWRIFFDDASHIRDERRVHWPGIYMSRMKRTGMNGVVVDADGGTLVPLGQTINQPLAFSPVPTERFPWRKWARKFGAVRGRNEAIIID